MKKTEPISLMCNTLCATKLKLLSNIFPRMLVYNNLMKNEEFQVFSSVRTRHFTFAEMLLSHFILFFSQIWINRPFSNDISMLYDHLLRGMIIINQSDEKVCHGTNFIFKFKHPEWWSDRNICNVLRLNYFISALFFAVLVDVWCACKSWEIHAGFPYVSNISDSLARVVIRLYVLVLQTVVDDPGKILLPYTTEMKGKYGTEQWV